jgi:S-adenosylmethionine synthetase
MSSPALPIRLAPLVRPADCPEIVERKGIGHPDTICDAIAEEFSLALVRFYRERFGLILHHNVDKVLLRGGASRAAFGGGRVLRPIEIYLAGRATFAYKGVRVPVEDLAVQSARAWLARHVPDLDPVRHVRIRCLARPGSADLVDLFERAHKSGIWLANDSSIGVGFAPLSAIEAAVLSVDRTLGGAMRSAPAAGPDIKILAVGNGASASFTVSCAFVGARVRDLADYLRQKRALAARIAAAVRRAGVEPAGVAVNGADHPDSGSIFLTATGTSAEAGDDGEAGRGNRVSGLITPGRPMTMEAAAGKNPVSHVGKLYNVAAQAIAQRLVRERSEIADAECWLASRIGAPVTAPQSVLLRLRMTRGGPSRAAARAANDIVREELERLAGSWRALLARRVRLY